MAPLDFHEVRFPTDIARGSTGGPVRRTEVIALASGREQRNARWKHSRRSYNAGYGVKSLDDLNLVMAFFEERRGRLYGFRFHDHVDFKSCSPGKSIQYDDHVIGMGDGAKSVFQLVKHYGSGDTQYSRQIHKPVQNSVRIGIDGVLKSEATDFQVDYVNGKVVFEPSAIPAEGTKITAGFEFDVPVRFDADEIIVNLKAFSAGDIPSIPLVELS